MPISQCLKALFATFPMLYAMHANAALNEQKSAEARQLVRCGMTMLIREELATTSDKQAILHRTGLSLAMQAQKIETDEAIRQAWADEFLKELQEPTDAQVNEVLNKESKLCGTILTAAFYLAAKKIAGQDVPETPSK